MKDLRFYITEITQESYYEIFTQRNWKWNFNNLLLSVNDDVDAITLNLSNIRSESGQRLLGLKFEHGFARCGIKKENEGIILLNEGVAVIPIKGLTYVYPIWGEKYFPYPEHIDITKLSYVDEMYVIRMVEYNIRTPYGHVQIFTENTGKIIEARNLSPRTYYRMHNINIFLTHHLTTVKYDKLPPNLQNEIAKRIYIE